MQIIPAESAIRARQYFNPLDKIGPCGKCSHEYLDCPGPHRPLCGAKYLMGIPADLPKKEFHNSPNVYHGHAARNYICRVCREVVIKGEMYENRRRGPKNKLGVYCISCAEKHPYRPLSASEAAKNRTFKKTKFDVPRPCECGCGRTIQPYRIKQNLILVWGRRKYSPECSERMMHKRG